MKRIFTLLIALTFILTACAPAATPAPDQKHQQRTCRRQHPRRQQAVGAYTPPEGAKAPVPLDEGSQSTKPVAFKPGAKAKIAYMPPATEFNYYMAIGEGIKAKAAEAGVEVFMLAPEKRLRHRRPDEDDPGRDGPGRGCHHPVDP